MGWLAADLVVSVSAGTFEGDLLKIGIDHLAH
jgi:hypothetical protein